MLLIRAVSFKGRPLGQEQSARFGEAGGTIGRGDNSTLVLPDPERYISRTHAIISFQAGGFVITDNGTTNPVILNGRPLGQGSQSRIGDGDEIKLGDFTLEVTLVPRSAPKDDPLAAFGTPAAKTTPPGAELATPPRTDRAIPPIPEPLSPDPLVGLRGREPSIDELFSLKPSELPDLFGPPLAQPEPARGVDPRELLGGTARPVLPPTVPDHGPEIFTPYVPPMAKAEPVIEARVAPVAPAAQPMAARSSGESATRPVSGGPTGPVEEPLLRAFLQGAGISDLPLPNHLTSETMEVIGKLLREAVQGTLDLLRARGLTKSEMRSDVTVIMSLDNNPLKFSPTVEAALAHLLMPQVRAGFMPPLRAMKTAYDDLRAHQLAFLAGMRAALEDVLARFAPEELQKGLSDPSTLDSLLPMNRKAKLWDLFVERYGRVAGEAQEDFNAAFGKAFLRAYEAQVKRLRTEAR